MLLFLVLPVFIIVNSTKLFASNPWIWYIVSTQITSGNPGYIDVVIGIKARSASDEYNVGEHSIFGTMSSDLYDFGEKDGLGIDRSPSLQYDYLDGEDWQHATGGKYDMEFPNTGTAYRWNLLSHFDYNNYENNGNTVKKTGTLVAKIRFFIKNPNGSSNIAFDDTIQSTYQDQPYPSPNNVPVDYDNTGGDVSLPVQMANLFATVSREEGVILHWRTESQADCAGFNVWKSETETGPYDLITTSLIPAQGNSSTATDYTFTDKNVHDGTVYWYKIEEISIEGVSKFFGPISVAGINPIPAEFTLSQNYPNPFNPVTTFEYQLPENSYVSMKVYTLLGQKIRTLIEEYRPAGSWTVKWDGTNDFGNKVPSGIYLLRMKAGSYIQIRRMTLTR